MAERVDLVDQVMSWEAEVITARNSLKIRRLSFQVVKILPMKSTRLWQNLRAWMSWPLSSRKTITLDLTSGWRLSSIIFRCTIRTWIVLS